MTKSKQLVCNPFWTARLSLRTSDGDCATNINFVEPFQVKCDGLKRTKKNAKRTFNGFYHFTSDYLKNHLTFLHSTFLFPSTEIKDP